MEQLANGLIALQAKWDGGEIKPEIPIAQVRSYIDDGCLVLLKNIFDQETLLSLRNAVHEWSSVTPEFPITQTATLPNLNHHRRDNVSDPKYITRLFHQYGFGDFSALPSALKEKIERVAEPLLSLENQLADTGFRHDMPEYRIKFYNHNVGGGFFQQHTHPYLPQKVAYFLSMSRYGKDYRQGHVIFRTPHGDRQLNSLFDIGNVVFFKYDLVHGVGAVDPQEELDWKSENGLWVLSGELIENYKKTTKTPDSRR